MEKQVPENFCLYTTVASQLPRSRMEDLGRGCRFEVRCDGFKYRWPDLDITIRQMPDPDMASHLQGFQSYVRSLAIPSNSRRVEEVLAFISQVTLVVGIEIAPVRDSLGRAEELIGRLAGGLQSMMFFENAVYGSDGRLLLGPNGELEFPE